MQEYIGISHCTDANIRPLTHHARDYVTTRNVCSEHHGLGWGQRHVVHSSLTQSNYFRFRVMNGSTDCVRVRCQGVVVRVTAMCRANIRCSGNLEQS